MSTVCIIGSTGVPSAYPVPAHQLRQQCRAEVRSHRGEGVPGERQKGERDYASKPHPDHHGDHGGCTETIRSHQL